MKNMSFEIVEYLPEMRDKEGSTLLTKAAYENNYKIFDCLIFLFKQRLSQKLKKTLPPGTIDKENINSVKRQVKKQIKRWINMPDL